MKQDSNYSLKAVCLSLVVAMLFLLCIFGFSSCNVTRTVTTQSEYFTKGDTTCTIITRTVESYDATKKLK